MSAGMDLESFYYVVYDDAGRIQRHGMESRMFIDAAIAAGERRLITGQRDLMSMNIDDYVDLSGDTPVLRDRPAFNLVFDKNPVAAGVEATLPGLPKCIVTIKGPVNGQYQHGGGDFLLGSTLPGDYELSFEAWPYKPATITLTVSG